MLCVWVFFPICIVYYESYESDGLKKKLKRSMQVAIPMFMFLVFLTVPTYFLLRDVSDVDLSSIVPNPHRGHIGRPVLDT